MKGLKMIFCPENDIHQAVSADEFKTEIPSNEP